MVVFPAYGRDYETEEDVKKDWEDNKDFRICKGPYINKSDYEKYMQPSLDSVICIFGILRDKQAFLA